MTNNLELLEKEIQLKVKQIQLEQLIKEYQEILNYLKKEEE